jgi:pyruvate dehydrogenase E2 component (dihydrolipoamide acetyltransferase)
MSKIDVFMPQMGVSVSEGLVTRWLKEAGDSVVSDEPLVEISTDKVDTEVPSPGSGILSAVYVREGETVAVGTVIGAIGVAVELNAVFNSEPSPSEAARPLAAPGAIDHPKLVSPVSRRIADGRAIDLASVAGTGHGGRVTKKDLEGAVTGPVSTISASVATAPLAVPELAAGETSAPMTRMRASIAEHMRRSLDIAAHTTSVFEVEMSQVAAARRRLREVFESKHGLNLTYLSFIAHATVVTLKDYPWVNGEIRGDQIVTKPFVNLGIAVELDQGAGLIVPVIKNAEMLNLFGMARAISDVARRARARELQPDEAEGGTFTITNPGGYGTIHGTPIINQPQSAILGMYAVTRRPWVVDDGSGGDAIAVRPVMNLTLTYDHRLVDGAHAGRFLRDLRSRLEDWTES